jgi:probable rRNA maturation factor
MTRSSRSPKAPPAITILIEDEAWRDETEARRLIRRATLLALASRPCRGRRKPAPQATILLASDSRLRALNHRFRGPDRVTNVLSFPGAPGSGAYLGDIALGYGRIAAEARGQAKSMAAHAAHLAVHGVLHLLGYDHQDRARAASMEDLEIALLQHLGLNNPYAPVRCTRGPKAA